MNHVEVLKCSCQDSFQDERYGKSLRLHNLAPTKTGKVGRYRCTKCATVRDLGPSALDLSLK